jgi:poly(A) polymerase Pap1
VAEHLKFAPYKQSKVRKIEVYLHFVGGVLFASYFAKPCDKVCKSLNDVR